jgi:hypothetical protein
MSPITKASGTKRVVLTRCPFVGRLLHPPDPGGAAVGVRAARRLRDAGAGLEKREWARDVLPEQDPARIRSPRQRVGVPTRTKEEAS